MVYLRRDNSMHQSEPEDGYRILARMIARRITGTNFVDAINKAKVRENKTDAKESSSPSS